MVVDIECARRLFAVADSHRMGGAVIFRPGERVGPIRGEIAREVVRATSGGAVGLAAFADVRLTLAETFA